MVICEHLEHVKHLISFFLTVNPQLDKCFGSLCSSSSDQQCLNVLFVLYSGLIFPFKGFCIFLQVHYCIRHYVLNTLYTTVKI